jgi:hypothetical protein
MFWRDIQLGRHTVFLRKGLRVLSAGHMFDELFFDRLLHIFQHSKTVHSPSEGSHLYYAASAGCHVCYEDQFEIGHSGSEEALIRDLAHADNKLKEETRSMFSNKMTTADQKTYADKFLGVANLKSPVALFLTLTRCALQCRKWRKTVFKRLAKRVSKQHVLQNTLSDAPFNLHGDGTVSLQTLS